MGNKTWHSEEVLRGRMTLNSPPMVTVLAAECVTYSLCGHRIYSDSDSDTHARAVGQFGTGDTPLQYIEVLVSAPQPPSLGSISTGCAAEDFPAPVPCHKMHLFFGQTDWQEEVLKTTLEINDRNGSSSKVLGIYDCVTRSMCAYSNPAP